ncbi:hypothetical protein, partial [Hydrogenophaga borbori]|uniref:hypothetical protein n=1 Tax=Hydrogenophaga borbori TaxID=2294117 RepID=UPI00301C6A62
MLGLAAGGVNALRAARQGFACEGQANATVGAGDEDDSVFYLHKGLLKNMMTVIFAAVEERAPK